MVALVFLALALWYNLILPIGESDNEVSHFRYVQYIKTERALPPADYVWPKVPTVDQCEIARGPEAPDPEHQFRQPPLYYLLTAAATAWLDTSDTWWPPINHYGVINRNYIEGGYNVGIHSAREAFPYQGTALAVHVMRFISTLIGLAGLLAVYLSGRLVFRQLPGPGPALLMATVAFIPTYLFAASVITNDILAGALGAWCIYFCLRSTLDDVHLGFYWLALLTTALAILAKYYCVVLVFPMGLTSVVLLVKARRVSRQRFWTSLTVVVLAVLAQSLLPVWWFLRNKMLYGSYVVDYPNAAQVLIADVAQAGNVAATGYLNKLVEDWAFTFDSFWALLGADVVRLPGWVIAALVVMCLAVGIGMLWNFRDRNHPRRLKFLSLAALAICLVSGGVLYLLNELEPLRGRYLLVVISVAGFLLVWGSSALRTARRPWLGSTLVVGLLLLICLMVPNGLLLPTYARPAILTEPDLAADAQPIEATFGDFAELLAVEVEPKSVAPFEPLQVTLVWRVLQPTTNNYVIGVHLSDSDNTYYGGSRHMPAKGNYATSLWQPGDIFRDRYTVYMEKAAEGKLPSAGKIKITMYCVTPTDEIYVPVKDKAGVALGDAVYAGPLRLGLPVTSTLAADMPVLARFGDEIDLLAVEQVSPTGEAHALSLPLQFTWQARQPPRVDYTVYLHLLDAQGRYVAGIDEKLTLGDYPSSLWPAGEVVTDVHPSDISPLLHVPRGSYQLVAGLYDHQTMERLPITTATLASGPDGVALGSWENAYSWLFVPYVIHEYAPPGAE